MGSGLRRRLFAMLLCCIAAGMIFAIPALAAANTLESIVDDYRATSEAKLDWFDNKVQPPATETQRTQAYEQTVLWLTQKADRTLEALAVTAGKDPILLAQIPELAEKVAQMEREFLEEAEKIYNSSIPPVTTTLPPVTTTSITLPPIATTSIPIIPTTSTTSTSTTSTTSTTTTTTVAAVITTTTRPQSGSAPVAVPPSAGTTASGGPVGDAITDGSIAIDASQSEANSQVLSEAVAAAIPRSQFLLNVEPSELAAAQQMLVPYEPGTLPSRLPAPVMSFLAVIQMVVGAFLSSFKQIGGPAAAGGLYLIYEVIRHVRSKAPGAAAPA